MQTAYCMRLGRTPSTVQSLLFVFFFFMLMTTIQTLLMCYRSLGGHYVDGGMMFIFYLLSVWPLCFGIQLGLLEDHLRDAGDYLTFCSIQDAGELGSVVPRFYHGLWLLLENKNKLETLISKSHSWIYEQGSPRRMVSKGIFRLCFKISR